MSSMLVSLIIVSYNTQELTLNALKSAVADIESTLSLKDASEVIVIDNNSSDGSVVAIRDYANTTTVPIHIIENKKNLGFAQANNQGMEKATGQYFLLLNSDTLIQAGALEKLLNAFETHPVRAATAELSSYHGRLDRLGVVAATLLNPDGSLQPQGGALPTLWSLACHMLFLDDLPFIGGLFPSTQDRHHSLTNDTHLKQQGWVGGTAMMIRREVVDEVGALDGNIFMYGEDVEFCLRARDHHWDVAIHPQARVTHFGSASSSSANALMGEFKGYLYIWSKHRPPGEMDALKGILRLGALVRRWIFGTMAKNAEKAQIYARILKEVL